MVAIAHVTKQSASSYAKQGNEQPLFEFDIIRSFHICSGWLGVSINVGLSCSLNVEAVESILYGLKIIVLVASELGVSHPT